MNREPAAIIGAISAAATAIIGLLVAFGFDLSDEQQKAILGAIGPVVVIIALTSAAIRSKVFAPKTVTELVTHRTTHGDDL